MEITSATTSGILAGIHQFFSQCCEMTELIKKKTLNWWTGQGKSAFSLKKASKLRQVNLISSLSDLTTIY